MGEEFDDAAVELLGVDLAGHVVFGRADGQRWLVPCGKYLETENR